MRWLLIVLLVSVGALVYVASALTRHVLRQRNTRPQENTPKELDAESSLDQDDPRA
jgi:hypothetical protein